MSPGQPISLEIISFFDFTSVGPVIVEQLKRAGIEATYSEPPNIFTRFSAGDYTGCLFGHGGSYSSDVYYSLRLYQTASTKIPGGHLVNFSRWHNEEYDKLVDELYGISPTETEQVMEIWKQVHGDLAAGIPGHPDLAGSAPPADQHDVLDGLAGRGESVRQHRPLAPDLAARGAQPQASRSVGKPSPRSLLSLSVGAGSTPLSLTVKEGLGVTEPRGAFGDPRLRS